MAANGTAPSPLRIVVGSDNAGHIYKTALKSELEKNPGVCDVLDIGVVDADDPTAYPHIAVDAGKKIMAGDVRTIHHCGTTRSTLTPLAHSRQTELSSSVALASELPSQPTRFRAFERSPQTTHTASNAPSSATMPKCCASGSGSLD
jgi:Ribose/Galactose Isomerase